MAGIGTGAVIRSGVTLAGWLAGAAGAGGAAGTRGVAEGGSIVGCCGASNVADPGDIGTFDKTTDAAIEDCRPVKNDASPGVKVLIIPPVGSPRTATACQRHAARSNIATRTGYSKEQ